MTPFNEQSRSSSVEIIKADWTRTTYARCTVDQFRTDELTVTSIDDGAVMGFYGPATWRTGTAFGVDGYPLFTFTSSIEEQRLRGVIEVP
jgi:hypothetical protein